MVQLTKEENEMVKHMVKFVKMIPKLVTHMDTRMKLYAEEQRKLAEKNEDCVALMEYCDLKDFPSDFFSDFFNSKRFYTAVDSDYNGYILPVHKFFEVMNKQHGHAWYDMWKYSQWMEFVLYLQGWKEIVENFKNNAFDNADKEADASPSPAPEEIEKQKKMKMLESNKKFGFTEKDYENMQSFKYFCMIIQACPKIC